MTTRHWPSLAGLLVAACSAPGERPSAADPCRDLVLAPPSEWQERLRPAHALGAAAVPRLLQLLRDHRNAPGGQAAVALLGRLGDAQCVPFLIDTVADRGPLATEAALALGDLRALAAAACLAGAVADRAADPTLRTAAACAQVQIGQRHEALPFLRAVLLAGSPAGVQPGAEVGLPVRPRWALERYLVQRLLLHEGEPALAQELDPDASWPSLQQLSERFCRWLEQPR